MGGEARGHSTRRRIVVKGIEEVVHLPESIGEFLGKVFLKKETVEILGYSPMGKFHSLQYFCRIFLQTYEASLVFLLVW